MIDFLVIGGGIAGVSAAARLSELGSVTLLERESALAYHASGRSAAMFEENYGAPSVKALSRASRAGHEAAGVLSPRGVMVISGPEDAATFDADCAELQLDPITVAEALDRVPILDTRKIDRAAIHLQAEDLDTDLLVQTYAKALRASGGQVVTNATVTDIARTATGWQVTTGEVLEAKSIVNAAGAWADQIAVMAGVEPIGLKPLRRSMARIPAPGGHDVSNWPMFFGPGETWYAKPDAGALLVSPADEDPQEPHDAWADDMVLAEGLHRYSHYVTEPVTRLITSWAGLRTFATDKTLVLGPDPHEPTFIWCAGQGGYGFQTAPGASQLLADVIAGRETDVGPDIARSVSPARFAK